MEKMAINADSGATATSPTQPTAVSVICKERNMLRLHGGRVSWRMEEVTVNRTRKRDDWALQIKRLVDEDYPDAKKIILVCDNLKTHNAASLYQAFSPEETRRIWERIELHHTPKHGLWLDMTEIELSVFTSQCLNRNIDSMEKLQEEATALYVYRNRRQKGIDWQFTVGDARSKPCDRIRESDVTDC